jgi:serralysin
MAFAYGAACGSTSRPSGWVRCGKAVTGAGDDTLSGGGGDDSFVFAPGSGADIVVDFAAGGLEDSLDLSAYAGTGITYGVAQVGADTVFTFSNGDTITLVNVDIDNLVQTDPFGWG